MPETTTQAIAPRPAVDAGGIMEKVLIMGNLADLKPEERSAYYLKVCESCGLNPFTRPFEYIVLNGKLQLYARKDATDQLRKIHGVSIVQLEREFRDGLYIVTAHAETTGGRKDISIGAVAIEKLVGDARANALMKTECVPLDSEILTRDGWKTYDQLNTGEQVLAYDVEADICRWTLLRNVTVYEAAPVCNMTTEKGQFSIECTPDHSWAIRRKEYQPDFRGGGSRGPRGPYANRGPLRSLVKAQSIKSGQSIILAAPSEDCLSILDPTEAAILGWALTDGTIQKKGRYIRLGICQSKAENFAEIRELVGAVHPGFVETISRPIRRTFPTGRTYDTLAQHWWYIPAAISRAIVEKCGFKTRADLPKIVTRLSIEARKAMLRAMMLAEGDKRLRFANKDRHILDAFQILSTLCGKALGQERTHSVCKLIRLKKTRHIAGSNIILKEIGIKPVWCPTTDFGTWVMRQHGQVMITGNTKSKRRVTLSICGLGFLDESEIESIPHTEPVPGTSQPAILSQIEQIEALIAKLHLSPQKVSDRLKERFGVNTLVKLTEQQADELAIQLHKALEEKERND